MHTVRESGRFAVGIDARDAATGGGRRRPAGTTIPVSNDGIG